MTRFAREHAFKLGISFQRKPIISSYSSSGSSQGGMSAGTYVVKALVERKLGVESYISHCLRSITSKCSRELVIPFQILHINGNHLAGEAKYQVHYITNRFEQKWQIADSIACSRQWVNS